MRGERWPAGMRIFAILSGLLRKHSSMLRKPLIIKREDMGTPGFSSRTHEPPQLGQNARKLKLWGKMKKDMKLGALPPSEKPPNLPPALLSLLPSDHEPHQHYFEYQGLQRTEPYLANSNF